ncbi:MAG TPA: HNH endonuclease family protein, partial [Acidobacteriaceae bacterium]|nr:HNH endonuclease family protein [Acidobacteriaceae bacterium]
DSEFQSFNQIMAALRALGSEYPIEDAIQQGLRKRDLYLASPQVCRYILWNYEESLAYTLGLNSTIDEHERAQIWRLRANDSIEHIFPQNASNGWRGKGWQNGSGPSSREDNVHRLGNLLLLPQPLNAQAQAGPFSQKKIIYGQHHLRMIDKVCALDDWTFDSIDERENELAAWAEKRWADI